MIGRGGEEVYSLGDLIEGLKSQIGDFEADFTDDRLILYIKRALNDLSRYVGNVQIVSNELSRPLSSYEYELVLVKAAILLAEALKMSADRDNFVITKNKLRIDNTKQASDHSKTLEYLNTKLNSLLMYGYLRGVRVE
jgi:hypothetical protein